MNKIKEFLMNISLRPKVKSWTVFVILAFVVVLGIFFTVNITSGVDDILSGMVKFATSILLWLSRIAIGFTIFFLRFFIQLAAYNDYISTPTVVIGWTMVRDVANMFFVVVLLAIAIGTILGLEQYEWKKTLAKFVLAAVFINFSKMICGLFIDVAHIFTITFLNAVVATAGGNIIQLFKLEEIQSMVATTQNAANEKIAEQLFLGAVTGLAFAVMAMVTMLAYAVVMLLRVIVLWVLIILSPLAYILSTLEQTKKYAEEWWSKFGNQVLVAPVMVFFLWLTFATLGNGNINNTINQSLGANSQFKVLNSVNSGEDYSTLLTSDVSISENMISLAKVSSWESMASFFIAIGFMAVGIGVVQQMGVVGGGMVSGALDFAKKTALIASGYAAGRWLAGKTVGGVAAGTKKAAGAAAWYAPVVGGEMWATRFKNEWGAVKSWYYGKANELTPEGNKTRQNLAETNMQREQIELERSGLDAEAAKIRNKLATATPEEAASLNAELAGIQAKKTAADTQAEALATKAAGFEKSLDEQYGGGIIGRAARARVAEIKRLKKTEGLAEVREKLTFKRVGSEAGGRLFEKREAMQSEAQDREERGELEGEEMRGKAKDAEFIARGRNRVLFTPRIKWAGVTTEKEKAGDKTRNLGAQPVIKEIIDRQAKAHGSEYLQKFLTSKAQMALEVDLKSKYDRAGHDEDYFKFKMGSFFQDPEHATKEQKEEARKRFVASGGSAAATDEELGKFMVQEQRAQMKRFIEEERAEESARTGKPAKPVTDKDVDKAMQGDDLFRSFYWEEMAHTAEQQQKQSKNDAVLALEHTEAGHEIAAQYKAAEAGATALENAIKGSKNKIAIAHYDEAKDLYAGAKDNPEELRRLVKTNPYVAAIYHDAELRTTESRLKSSKSLAEQALDRAQGSEQIDEWQKKKDLFDKYLEDQKAYEIDNASFGSRMAAFESSRARVDALLPRLTPADLDAIRTGTTSDTEALAELGGDATALAILKGTAVAPTAPVAPTPVAPAGPMPAVSTFAMQRAEADKAGEGAASYMKVAARNSVRTAVAASKLDALEKAVERRDVGAEDALARALEEDPYIMAAYQEKRAERTEAKGKEAKNNLVMALGGTDVGREIVEQIADAEMGAKIGEDFIKSLKEDKIRKKFQQAKKLLEDAKKQDAMVGNDHASDKLMAENKYVAALHYAEEAAVTAEEAKAAREDADLVHSQIEQQSFEGGRMPQGTQLQRKKQAEVAMNAVKSMNAVLSGATERYEEAARTLRSLNDEISRIEASGGDASDLKARRDDYLEGDAFAREVYFDQLKKEDEQKEKRYKGETTNEMLGTEQGKRSLTGQLEAEQATKRAEEALKEIKNNILGKEFLAATRELKAILDQAMSVKELNEALVRGSYTDKKTGAEVHLSEYARVMAQVAAAARSEKNATLAKKMAEDMGDNAFVSKPFHGLVKPSTVLAEASDAGLKEWKKMQRLEAMEKGMDVLEKMFEMQDSGEELSWDQVAEQNTALDFLSSEAWVDDQHGAMMSYFTRIRKLQEEKAAEGKTYELTPGQKAMMKRFKALGWVGEEDVEGKDEDGNDVTRSMVTLKASAEGYTRKEARDLQALGSTGADSTLLLMHTKTEDVLDENARAVKIAERDAIRGERDALLDETKTDEESVAARTLRDEVTTAATADADSRGLTGDAKVHHVEDSVNAALATKFFKRFKKAQDEARKRVEIDYWRAAEIALERSGGSVGTSPDDQITKVDDFVERYRKHYDTMQQMSRNGVTAGMNTGHAELMYNLGYDADRKVIRMRTVREATAESEAERVKMRTQQQLEKDQYHTYGRINQKTGLLTHMDISMMRTALGRVERAIDVRNMPERSALAYLQYHKLEQVETRSSEGLEGAEHIVDEKGNKVTVQVMTLGGDAMRAQLREEGLDTPEAQRNRMLGQEVLRELLANGGLGLGILSHSKGKHITESQAKVGVLNWDAAGKFIGTQHQLIDEILRIGEADRETVERVYLAGTEYEGDWDRARQELTVMRDNWEKKYRAAPKKVLSGESNPEATTPEAELAAQDSGTTPGGGA